MGPLTAVMYREMKIRATNAVFVFWDLCYPLAYLLLFGVGMTHALGGGATAGGADYTAFFLAGVLSMASFGIAANTSWSFFLDRDNGMFTEMLTYPLGRGAFLIGKVLFNVVVAVLQAAVTAGLAWWLLGVRIQVHRWPILLAAVVLGTAGWFFFYAIFALWIRRNDAYNTVTSIFYFIFLFVSSMFYPLDRLPPAFRALGYANPVTWQTDILRFATIGTGTAATLAVEAAAFLAFGALSFVVARWALERQG